MTLSRRVGIAAAIAALAVGPATAQPPDTTPPETPVAGEPAGRTNETLPVFQWSPVRDVVPAPALGASGLREYRLTVRRGMTVVLSQVLEAGWTGEYRFRLPASARLTDGVAYTWTVSAADEAGNTSTSVPRAFTVDVASPDPPQAAGGFVRVLGDISFSFTGAPNAAYVWGVRDATGSAVTMPAFAGTGLFNGGGRTDEVRLAPPPPDGTYAFWVRQTPPGGAASGERVVLIDVDTTAPGAPLTTLAPEINTDGHPVFGWSPTELGGSYHWQVLPADGASDAWIWDESTEATTGRPWKPLPPGSFLFRVAQTDPSGNVGPWSTPRFFRIVAEPPPAYGPPVAPPTPGTRNAGVLRPRAGTRVTRGHVVLRWPRAGGASRYRVQVLGTVAGRTRVVHAATVGAPRHAVPPRVLAPGARYRWRVFPLRASGRPSRVPLGISWFVAVR